MRLFLAAHWRGLAFIRIPEARLLKDLAAFAQDLLLPLDLVLHRRLREAEGIDILQLHLRPQLLRASRSQREIRLAAQAPFLHIAVADL